MKIESIAQAQESATELAEFLGRINQTIAALGSLTGKSNGHSRTTSQARTESPAPSAALRIVLPVTSPVPATMPDRIFAILRDADKPLTPKEMTEQYRNRGWPEPKSGKLYSQLLASAYYLSNKKGKLKNDGGRYSIIETEAKV